jgi:hypothetical protein
LDTLKPGDLVVRPIKINTNPDRREDVGEVRYGDIFAVNTPPSQQRRTSQREQ